MKKYLKKITVLSTATIILCFVGIAQQASNKKTEIPFPIIPFIVEYEYAPYYFSQDIYEHPQYSLIEAFFEPDKPASLQLVLTERDTKKRTFYCNAEFTVKTRSLEGKEAVLAKIDFKPASPSQELPTYEFAFRDKQGQPILWRVIPTTRPSERGAGLTPMGGATALRLEYRDFGTQIGEGTIVKIGEKLFEAVPWPQASSPPYYYAYHGAFTVGRHIGAFPVGTEKWLATSGPEELKEGSEWTLTNDRGRKRIFRIAAMSKDELTVNETAGQKAEATSMSFVLRNSPQGFAMRSLQLKNRGKQMQIAFAPELPMYLAVSGRIEVAFTISQGKVGKVASGNISVERMGEILNLRWHPTSPDWAKSNSLETRLRVNLSGYVVETLPVSKK